MRKTYQGDDPKSKDLLRLKRRINSLKQELDLVEIFCNFWPLDNMKSKRQRLKHQLETLKQQIESKPANLGQNSPYSPITLPPVSEITQNTAQSSHDLLKQALHQAERIDANLFNPFQRNGIVHAG
jgi:hypothetical protein